MREIVDHRSQMADEKYLGMKDMKGCVSSTKSRCDKVNKRN